MLNELDPGVGPGTCPTGFFEARVDEGGSDEALAVAACSVEAARAADDISGGGLTLPSSAVDVVAVAAKLIAVDDPDTGASNVLAGPSPICFGILLIPISC